MSAVMPNLDDGNRCAIYYDLAHAYEASGDKKSALANSHGSCGSDIDFRDFCQSYQGFEVLGGSYRIQF